MNDHGRTGIQARKKAVSIRMSRSDVRQIKQLAARLGARESDVIRFAIKIMLTKLAPLQDLQLGGRALVPVFMEAGAELMQHFELDAARLSAIINDGVKDERRVEPDDIQLIAMSGIQRSYPQLRVPGLRPSHGATGAKELTYDANGNGQNGGSEADTLEQSLRRYLFEKYLYDGVTAAANGSGNGA